MIFIDIIRFFRAHAKITDTGVWGRDSKGKKIKAPYENIKSVEVTENEHSIGIHVVIKKQNGSQKQKFYRVKHVANLQEFADTYNQSKPESLTPVKMKK